MSQTEKEQAVRDAANALAIAIADARAEGLHIQWPHSPEGLAAIAVSEAKKPSVTMQVNSPGEVSAETLAKAGTAAQNAADKIIEKATGKA